MSKQLRKSLIGAALLGLTTVLATPGHALAEARTFTIAAVEPRGGANVDQDELKRGHVTKISFKADKAGVFPIECHTHTPSMRAELVVLPRK